MSSTSGTPRNAHNEIIDIAEADQFPPGKTQFACGFFACAMARSMAPVGQPPTLSIQQIIDDAEAWYAQYNGSNDGSNMDGMSTEQEYELLRQIGLHYQATSTDSGVIKRWIEVGYPVIIAIVESSVRDLDLGKVNPYPWTPNGNHIVVVTGVADDGNLLVRDSANCTNLYDPGSLRPGPRRYDASMLQLVSATVAVPPWKPRPVSSNPPAGDTNMHIPSGWSDDGKTLCATNGQKVVLGFRGYILEHTWDATDIPLAPEAGANPVELAYSQPGGHNSGTRQFFMYSELCYTAERGVYRASVGRECWTLLKTSTSPTSLPSSTTQAREVTPSGHV